MQDVAIIGECQCLEDTERGGAWVRALLGVNAATVYCAEDGSATHLIQELARQCGDEVEIRDHTRLSPLRVSEPVSSVKEIRPGDCVIGFSRQQLFKLKEEIERDAGVGKCAMVYGALPPETRREQARLFNDPDSEHTVLVATDAVGMGLNLNIKRVIFKKMEKFDGLETRPLTSREIKQIGGRAGRFGTAFADGQVTCWSDVGAAGTNTLSHRMILLVGTHEVAI